MKEIKDKRLKKWLFLHFVAVVRFTILLIVVSCNKSIEYSNNPSHILSLSTDTISFDTVFTSIGSVTKSMTIYNKNSAALRLSASLAGAESSNFRMNIYGENGITVQDIEIAPKDSLYLFVAVTIDPDQRDNAFFIGDSILFTLESGVIQKIMLVAYGQNVNIIKGLKILNDSVFTSNKPYLILDSLYVAPEATLRIMPGATLYFHKGAGLGVAGTLIATGTPDSLITFRTDRLDNLFNYLPYDKLPGQWEGINLYSGSYYNKFEHCRIYGAHYGIAAISRNCDTLTLTLNSTSIHNIEGSCIDLKNSFVIAANSLFSNAGINCVSLIGGRSRFQFCTIANFYPWGEKDRSLAVSNKQFDNLYPLLEATFINCIITGTGKESLGGEVVDSLSPSFTNELSKFKISNSLLLTTDTLREYFFNNIFDRSENAVSGSKNFRFIDGAVLNYDFRLDSLSPAREIGLIEYVAEYPVDIIGVPRTDIGRPDSGCYQYTPY
ncbi:MAG TPA: hypothetical protein VFC94_01455 [Bacteroidaceae bacterium]|nr:hypothetical protein [Bacteroidaceae bacterium]